MGLPPSKMTTVLPGAPVPLIVGVVSSVTLPLVNEPIMTPASSSISVTCGRVSTVLLTVNATLFDGVLAFPAASVAMAVSV